MDPNLSALAVPLLVFSAVALIGFFAASGVLDRRKVRERYAATTVAGSDIVRDVAPEFSGSRLGLDPKTLGLSETATRQLRAILIQAGHFGPNAVVIYTLIRTALVILIPLASFLAVQTY